MDLAQVLVKTFSVHVRKEAKEVSLLGLFLSYCCVKYYLPGILASSLFSLGGRARLQHKCKEERDDKHMIQQPSPCLPGWLLLIPLKVLRPTFLSLRMINLS